MEAIMPLTIDTDTYENDVARTPDLMRYTGPAHTLSVNDYVDLGRTAPKPTADYAGKGRARFKIVRNSTDGTDSLGDAIIDINVSFPVGMQSTEQDAIINDVATWFATTSAQDLFKDGDINQ
jgi:hypothetical protein